MVIYFNPKSRDENIIFSGSIKTRGAAVMIHVGDMKIGPEEKAAINMVLDSGHISEGKMVKDFEREFALKIGTRHSIAVSSGTSALIAGLLALIYSGKIKKGSSVITTPVTYISTVSAIVLTGLKPVFADLAPGSLNIGPKQIEEAIKREGAEKCSLILPVHLMGYPCDMIKINELASKYGLLVFEDAAQAHGTKINGVNVGNFSILADYSFYIAHNIQVGEMGAITTNDTTLAKLIRQIKANGRSCDCLVCTRNSGVCPHEPLDERDMDPRFTHNVIGYNFKTMEFTAALGLVQLKRFDEIINKRRENVAAINSALKKFENIFKLPQYMENVSYLAYPMIIKKGSGISRRELRKKLADNGVESRPLFGCIPLHQPAYAYLKEEYEGRLPEAESTGANGFYIGCHQYIEKSDISKIEAAFEAALK
jgi:perosamine synthetase